jgi:hypothetical protein
LKHTISGLGVQHTALVNYVRIDMDDTGKGIHFNAKSFTDQNDKLAAVITSTVSQTPPDRKQLYENYLKTLEPRSASTIWTWWSTGTP